MTQSPGHKIYIHNYPYRMSWVAIFVLALFTVPLSENPLAPLLNSYSHTVLVMENTQAFYLNMLPVHWREPAVNIVVCAVAAFDLFTLYIFLRLMFDRIFMKQMVRISEQELVMPVFVFYIRHRNSTITIPFSKVTAVVRMNYRRFFFGKRYRLLIIHSIINGKHHRSFIYEHFLKDNVGFDAIWTAVLSHTPAATHIDKRKKPKQPEKPKLPPTA